MSQKFDYSASNHPTTFHTMLMTSNDSFITRRAYHLIFSNVHISQTSTVMRKVTVDFISCDLHASISNKRKKKSSLPMSMLHPRALTLCL